MTANQETSIVLLGSGDRQTGSGGSTIREILRCSALGLIGVKVNVVICNNSRAAVPGFYDKIDYHNQEFGTNIEVRTVNGARFPAQQNEPVVRGLQTRAEATACADIIQAAGASFFVQAGFLKRVAGPMLELDGINSHPGPIENPGGIPGVDTKGLYGIHVQEAVIDGFFPYSAHTVHQVTADYDSGDIIAWRPVLVRPGDTPDALFDRVQIVEKACLPDDIDDYARRYYIDD